MPTRTLLTRIPAALTLAALASALPAGAQQRAPDQADAPVPETRYWPAADYCPAPGADATPDRHWQALNRTVAGYDSMALTMPDAPQQANSHAAHGRPAGDAHQRHAGDKEQAERPAKGHR